MAVTSLWHIKGSLKELVEYVENPEKTTPVTKEMRDFFDVFSYVQRPEATQGGEYVTAINCLRETALQQMILTKKQYGKEDKYIAWHGYQSFKPGEVTPEICHKIGVETAKEMWGDRFQIIVTTHLDKDHLHNHFCFNSVSFRDGKKYNYSKSERQRFMDISDRICREYGLSIIEKPHKAPLRPVWMDEKSGKPTRYNIYREDVRDAINGSRTPEYMQRYLNRRGYITDFTGKHWKIRLPQYEHFTRLDTLEEHWTPQEIRRTMGRGAYYGNRRPMVFVPQNIPEEYRTPYKPKEKKSNFYRLYLHYCYLLGILPDKKVPQTVSPYLKADIRKMEQISAEARYMAKYDIHTLEELYADRENLQGQLSELIAARTKLQNKIRRAPAEKKEPLRKEKADITAQITDIRKRLKWNEGIETRSVKMQKDIDLFYANENRAREAAKQKQRTERER